MFRISRIFATLLFVVAAQMAIGQQFMTRTGQVHFFSSTPMEDIEAHNEQLTGLLTAEGKFAFRIPILGFRFEKALMEEHFNENYMESEKFPNGVFEGTISDWNEGLKDGEWHNVKAEGELNIHGIAVTRTINSKLKWTGESWSLESDFLVPTASHEIKIPKMVMSKIAEEISVHVEATLLPR